jgi:hypothetical protein
MYKIQICVFQKSRIGLKSHNISCFSDEGSIMIMHCSSVQVMALKSSWLPLNGLIKGLLLFKLPRQLVQWQKQIVV